VRSAACLQRALGVLDVSDILVVGYAGALDTRLKLGTLVAVRRALACGFDKSDPAVEHIKLERTFVLAPNDSALRISESLRLAARSGDTITTSHVWGNPEHKNILMRKFRACIVDMETAALAGVSEAANIPLRCVRVVSDEAEDSFLEPFSYDPSAGIPERAGRLIRNGNPLKTYRRWKRNASEAQGILSRFLSGYL
jgi:nucleoside phosphorylase